VFDFEKPKIEIAQISEDKKYGRFVVEPLERGYGTTLGNSLRRIMLSSLPGAAVSQVKIESVLHEFSSIPGVKEDVTEIIMNIKNLALKNTSPTNDDSHHRYLPQHRPHANIRPVRAYAFLLGHILGIVPRVYARIRNAAPTVLADGRLRGRFQLLFLL
jgi:hypothetical protein